jgi:WD40 repeat protein
LKKQAIVCGFVFVFVLSQLGSVPRAGAEEEQRPLWSYQAENWLCGVSISSDGSYIAANTYGKVYLFSLTSNTPLWIYPTHPMEMGVGEMVAGATISSNGNYIVAGSGRVVYPEIWEGKVCLFTRTSSIPLWTYQTEYPIYSVAISSDGNYIAAGASKGPGLDPKIYLFSRVDNTPLWSYTVGDIVWSISTSSDGSYIAAGSDDNRIYLFNKDNNTPLWSYQTGGKVWDVFISSNGSYIVARSVSHAWPDPSPLDKKVYLFSRADNTPLWSYTTDDYIYSVSISSDGSYIVAGGYDNKIYLFSRSDNIPLWSYQTGGIVYSVISSDGSHIASVSRDNRAYLFSRTSSTPLWSYMSGDELYSVSVSSDGNYIAVGGVDGKIYLFSRGLQPGPTTEFPTRWVVAAIVIVTAIIGALLFIKKRK